MRLPPLLLLLSILATNADTSMYDISQSGSPQFSLSQEQCEHYAGLLSVTMTVDASTRADGCTVSNDETVVNFNTGTSTSPSCGFGNWVGDSVLANCVECKDGETCGDGTNPTCLDSERSKIPALVHIAVVGGPNIDYFCGSEIISANNLGTLTSTTQPDLVSECSGLCSAHPTCESFFVGRAASVWATRCYIHDLNVDCSDGSGGSGGLYEYTYGTCEPDTITSCNPGEGYNNGGPIEDGSCTPCLASQNSDGITACMNDVITSCAPGEGFFDGGAANDGVCTACDAPFNSDGTTPCIDDTITSCPAGEGFHNGGGIDEGTCTPCLASQNSNGTTDCIDDTITSCNPGESFSDGGVTSEGLCTACLASQNSDGTVCVNDTITSCPPGEGINNGGPTSNGFCAACAGSQNSDGTTPCIDDTITSCTPGESFSDGSVTSEGSCTACLASQNSDGTVCVNDTITSCTPGESFSDGGAANEGSCTACSASQNSDGTACVNDTITSCNPGESFSDGGVTSEGSCTPCLASQNSDGTVCIDDTITSCNENEGFSDGGAANEGSCTACAEGEESDGTTACTEVEDSKLGLIIGIAGGVVAIIIGITCCLLGDETAAKGEGESAPLVPKTAQLILPGPAGDRKRRAKFKIYK
jgi:hypothetical protein